MQMVQARSVEMAAFERFCQLLQDEDHNACFTIITGLEMKQICVKHRIGEKQIRVRTEENIFRQCKKKGYVTKWEVFDISVVDLSDISDDGRYYYLKLFVPSIASQMNFVGSKTKTADGAYCLGVGNQSYGNVFEVPAYDINNHIVPVVFFHSVTIASSGTWGPVFAAPKDVPCFDTDDRATIVDQEKATSFTYRSTISEARRFLDILHIKKNMSPGVGEEKSMELFANG